MNCPYLSEISRQSELVTKFGGYHHSGNAGVNTFYDMCDLSSDKYPLLSSRESRGKLVKTPASGIFSENGIIRLSGDEIQSVALCNERAVFCTKTKIYVNGEALNCAAMTDISPLKHKIVPFGRNFFIYPDGIYVVLNNDGTYTAKWGKYNYSLSSVLLTFCNALGADITYDESGGELPGSPFAGERFLLTSDEGAYLYTYTSRWDDGVRVHLKMRKSGIDKYAYKGEIVNVKKLDSKITPCEIVDYESGMLVTLPDGKIPQEVIDAEGMLVKSLYLIREMPELDTVCEHDNRLWGCRYGNDSNGNFVNEIYASKQGEPIEWNTFDGISTDSYAASLGCAGAFTGACSLDGEVVFFKENSIIKINGTSPSEYTVNVIPARGVKKGSEDTLVILNEKAFYKSLHGVAVYDGALPYLISDALGELEYAGICASSWKGKYYIKISENGKNAILVYDTKTGLWHRESDDENTVFFVNVAGKLFSVCKAAVPTVSGTNEYTVWVIQKDTSQAFDIFRLTEQQGTEYNYIGEQKKEWYALTGNICSEFAGTRYVRSVSFRISGDENTAFRVFVHCNNELFFREICNVPKVKPGLFTFSVNTPRCDGFELKICGTGDFTLHSLNIITEKGNGGNVNGQ